MTSPPRPLIVRLRNWVGDVTLGVPTLQRLADHGYALQLVGKGWARDLLAGVFYHPTLEEMLQSALQDIVRQIDTGASHPLGVLPLAPQDKASAP